MATVLDITTTPLSGLNHIDALLDSGPDWNFFTPAGNRLYYTFSIASGNESGQGGQQSFSIAQQAATRTALDYISKLTGIQFMETFIGTDAQIHLCNVNLAGFTTTGLCSWHSSYSYDPGNNTLRSYDVDAYVYLDNKEWFAENQDLTPGGYGYETLLHELGHALGLKHPFDDSINLPAAQDNTDFTLMSYDHSDSIHSTFSEYDVAALNWLYGGDGLAGAFGVNSTGDGRYITGTGSADTLVGTSANDKLEGDGGNDMIDGGNGLDTAVFRGVRSNYAFSTLANGDLVVTSLDGIDGIDTLRSIETLQFADMSMSRAAIADTTPPAQPSMAVAKGAAGYVEGNTPVVSGKAEANATIKVFMTGSAQPIGVTTADANGNYMLKLSSFADGVNYNVYATATDAAGNVSVASDQVSFKVDVTPPPVPTMVVTKNVNGYSVGNAPLVTIKAEVGATVKVFLADTKQLVGSAVDNNNNGLYSFALNPFKDGPSYKVFAIATDAKGNESAASEIIDFKVDATQPSVPKYNSVLKYSANGNQVTFSEGTAEAGTTIELIRAGDLQTVARTTVGSDGKWQIETSPLPNGAYTISVVSADAADNSTSAANRATLTINSAANISGTAGADLLKPEPGNNAVDGGAGVDTAIYAGLRSSYQVSQEAWGFGITDKTGTNGHDSLINVERIQFDDTWVALDIDGMAGQIFRLYSAVLGRSAEAAGMGYWIWRMENGSSINTVAREFMSQPEFDSLYGVNPSDQAFVTKLYENVLHRAPEAAGLEYWLGALKDKSPAEATAIRTQMLIDFSDSLENQVNVVGKLQLGVDFAPWHQN